MSDYYTYELRDDEVWLADLDVHVDFEVWLDDIDIDFRINAITAEYGDKRCNLLTSEDPLIKSLGQRIKEKIEQDRDWIEDRAQDRGLSYRSRGGTDPSARWVYA